jgi:hypothetical protein
MKARQKMSGFFLLQFEKNPMNRDTITIEVFFNFSF